MDGKKGLVIEPAYRATTQTPASVDDEGPITEQNELRAKFKRRLSTVMG